MLPERLQATSYVLWTWDNYTRWLKKVLHNTVSEALLKFFLPSKLFNLAVQNGKDVHMLVTFFPLDLSMVFKTCFCLSMGSEAKLSLLVFEVFSSFFSSPLSFPSSFFFWSHFKDRCLYISIPWVLTLFHNSRSKDHFYQFYHLPN